MASSALSTMASSSNYVDLKKNVFLSLKRHHIPNELIHMIFNTVRFTTTQYIDTCLPTPKNHALDKPKGSIFTDCFNTPDKLLNLDLVAIADKMIDIKEDPKNRRRFLLLKKLTHIATVLHDSILPYMDAKFNPSNYQKRCFIKFIDSTIKAGLLLIKDTKVRGINNPENILTLWIKYGFDGYWQHIDEGTLYIPYFSSSRVFKLNVDQSCLEYTANFALDNNNHLYIGNLLKIGDLCDNNNVHIWNCTLPTIERLFTFSRTLPDYKQKTYHSVFFQFLGYSAIFVTENFRPDVINLLFARVQDKEIHFISAVLACCCIFASPNTIPEDRLVDAVTYIIRRRLPSKDHVAVFYRIIKKVLSDLEYHSVDNPNVYLDLFDPELENHSTVKPDEWSDFILD
jgi:hypothetical protein